MRLDRLWLSLLPWWVGAVSLGLTGWLWQHERASLQRALKADFDFSVRQTASRIESRIATYEQMLRGVQGLFQAADGVPRAAFGAYVDTLLAGADYAGVQYFAYASKVGGAAAVTGVNGASDTTGVTGVTGANATARLAYVAPATGLNLKLLGEDPLAEPVRRAAMQLAADSGGLGITARLADLFTPADAAQPGFMMFLPVYARGKAVDSVAARRAALEGWVVTGVRMNDLMSSLYGEGARGVEVRVHDGVEVDSKALMYGASPSPKPGEGRAPLFEVQEYIGVAGHTWTLAVRTGPAFEQRAGGDPAQIIAWSGLGWTVLLALLTHLLVSGRQRANDVAMAMTREVRASEERYRRIVETADEGIWVTDPQSRTSFVNAKLSLMLGYTGAQILGRRLEDFLDETAPVDGAPEGQRQRELTFRHKDGSPLWASMTTSPIVDAAGQPAGALSMVTDITARKQAEALRLELETQLRESQKMEAIGTLAGGIAHDFNNILAAILGNVALAQLHVPQDVALKNSLEQISKGAVRARSLVQQILAFSRRQPHRLVSQPLGPVVEDAVRLLRPILPASAALEVRLADDPMYALADATQLQQVVMNLCTNAWYALEGRAGQITVGLDGVALHADAAKRLGLRAGEHALLWVSDTGVGMDEATRARVFEPFFTTKPVGQGTGLGLAVVHGIVATHGGAISVSSLLGQGSRFEVHLPLLAQPEHAPTLCAAAPDAASSAGRHVVYIDDDPVMGTMVQALLRNAGYSVTCFEDPRQALSVLCERPEAFDIVVTDYNMPGLCGLDLARELARLRPGLPVVISSGFVSEELIAAASQAGVRSVMQKEYTLEQLTDIVRASLQPIGGR